MEKEKKKEKMQALEIPILYCSDGSGFLPLLFFFF
jgi:hypothetical protein